MHREFIRTEPGADDPLHGVVHELFAAGLDLHTAIGLLSGHVHLARDRVHTAIARLDETIRLVQRAQAQRVLSGERAFVDALDELAGGHVGSVGLSAWLSAMAHRCATLLEVDAAGFVLVHQQVVASYPDVVVLPLCELREGPCHESCRTGQPVAAPDLTRVDDRWPRFTAGAEVAGLRAVHTLPLRSGGVPLGALALFNATVTSLSADDKAVAQGLADLAAVAVVQEQALGPRGLLVVRLQTALADRRIVEQAKGVVSERHGISVAGALVTMTAHAHLYHVSVPDIARMVVDGVLDMSDTVRRTR